MRVHKIGYLLMACLTILGSRGAAQEEKPVAIRLDMDIRSRLAAVGKSRTALYNGSLLMNAKLGSGLHLHLLGTRRFGNDVIAQQANVEKEWGTQRLQAGIVQLPFGIYDHRETYASGLIDYPMPRQDYALNSVDWGVPGFLWSGGSPNLQVEAAAFNGRSAGVWNNQNNAGGGALRLQTYQGSLLLGASYWDGYLDTASGPSRHRPVHLSGLDLRYTRSHLVVRGEYLFGVLNGNQMHGWYLDAYYRLPKYEKVTLAMRLEELKPDTDDPLGKQVTLGVRYTLNPHWIVAVNWRRNNMNGSYAPGWTPYAGKGGDIFFQLYWKMNL